MNDEPQDHQLPEETLPQSGAQEASGAKSEPGFAAQGRRQALDDEPPGEMPLAPAVPSKDERWQEPPRERARRSIWRPILLYGGLAVAILLAIGTLAAVVYIWLLSRDLPSVEALENYTPPITTRVYAGDGTLIG